MNTPAIENGELIASSNKYKRAWPAYNTIWRWHFYAGLFCIPFILLLSITGAIYLFKPQVEAGLDREFDQLVLTGKLATPAAQVSAALAVVPGGVLNAYELPTTTQSAARVLIRKHAELYRVYVHPENLHILKQELEKDKLMRIVHRIHGNLLMGDRGSNLVELAASWAIIMLITGLYLWWPRNTKNLAGVLYPRFKSGKRAFWRDLHGITGFWISLFALFLLLSGMPWTKSWGGLLKEVRTFSAGHDVKQDWTTGGTADAGANAAKISDSAEHLIHQNQHPRAEGSKTGMIDYTALNLMVASVQSLHLAPPVLIAPPSNRSTEWTARSDAQNRPLRVNLILDASTGAVKSRKDFADRPLLDRIIGIGIAVHEGQLFGWLNQLLGLVTAVGLILLSVSALVLWWRRRDSGVLGAPKAIHVSTRASWAVVSIIICLGVLLPFLGLSIMMVMLMEHAMLRHIPVVREFLGLRGVV